MKLIALSIATILLCFAHNLFAQDYKTSYQGLTAKGDTTATKTLLNKWKKADPNDPEMYIACYNFYVKEGLKEVISLSTVKPKGEGFQLTDSTGKVAGYLGGEPSYNMAYIKQAFNCIDTAITKFPARLDIHFGKIYLLGQLDDYKNFTREIVKTITYGNSINYKWYWKEGKPLDDPENFMLGTLQNYVVQLFNKGDQNVDFIAEIATAVLRYKPDDVENLFNLSISYLIKKDYPRALGPLLKAEKIAPHDYIVLNNIAYCYEQEGNKPGAIKYYQLVTQYGNEAAKANAQKKLTLLQKN